MTERRIHVCSKNGTLTICAFCGARTLHHVEFSVAVGDRIPECETHGRLVEKPR
jgi:hypothetical protein